ncbi:hypothetical protein ACTA71_004394 [Dictyostelium dimigraforme]
MLYKINSIRQKRDENEIINFISNSSLKDRSLLLTYISKLSSNGLYIPNIDSLISFCEEIIILKGDKIDDRHEDLVAKWYWADDDIKGNQTDYRPYTFETCKRLEKAKKNKINCIRISDVHYVDTVSFLQVRFDNETRVRFVKREPPKIKEGEILPEQLLITDNNNNDDKDKDDNFVQWYWAKDGPRGQQDVWVKYSKALSDQMEKGYQNSCGDTSKDSIKIKVDDQRYVDTRSLLQVRYDSKFSVRLVKREGKLTTPSTPTKNGSISAPTTPKKSTNTLGRIKTFVTPNKRPLQYIAPIKTYVDTSTNLKTLPNDTLLDILTLDEINYLLKKLTIAIPDSKTTNGTNNSSLKKFTISIFKSTLLLNNNNILQQIVLKK